MRAWRSSTPGATARRFLNLGGGGPQDTTQRRSTDWVHTALVQGLAVRDYVKFDDQPTTVDGVAESFLKAYRYRHDRTERAGLYLPRYRCAGSARSTKPMVVPACAAVSSAGGTGGQSGVAAHRRASPRRSAVAGHRRRRVRQAIPRRCRRCSTWPKRWARRWWTPMDATRFRAPIR